jgi:hypothetical protein
MSTQVWPENYSKDGKERPLGLLVFGTTSSFETYMTFRSTLITSDNTDLIFIVTDDRVTAVQYTADQNVVHGIR